MNDQGLILFDKSKATKNTGIFNRMTNLTWFSKFHTYV